MSERETRTLTQWLIQAAARRAPSDLSKRLCEEWQADLATRHSRLSRLRFALGCCWATGVIVREHGPSPLPAAALVTPKGLLDAVRDARGIVTHRSFTFCLVAGLHVALFYALMTGLAFRVIKAMPTPFQTKMIEPSRARLEPPPPPALFKTPRLELPPARFPVAQDPVEDDDIVADPATGPGPVSPPASMPAPPPREVIHRQGGPGGGFPATDDYYPTMAKRMEEQGVATVHVCVGADGRLTSNPIIEQSAGSPRLDDGALRLARAGDGHYRPSTEDGRAVNGCYSFRVRFALRTGR
jgi:protein TonB